MEQLDVQIQKNWYKENFNFHLLLDRLLLMFVFNLYFWIDIVFLKRSLFLDCISYLSIILAFIRAIFIIKYYDFVYYLLKLFSIVFISNVLIKHHNPFFNSLFFWVPFQDILRCLLMIKFVNYFLECDYENLDINTKKQLLKTTYIGKIINYRIFTTYMRIIGKLKMRNKILLISILVFSKCLWFIITDNFVPPSYNIKVRQKKYFICANLFNNINIIEDWTEQLLKLIDYLGKDNVYVSILENDDSSDGTTEKLKEFEEVLKNMKIGNYIVTQKVFMKEYIPRIDYLVNLRNFVVEPIYSQIDWMFDEFLIIFFNDIIYKWQDIVKLIMTNDMNYDIACGLDFYYSFYDKWVSRDLDDNIVRNYYPFFADKTAQNNVINGQPIRIFSCWNGVAVLNPMPFRKRYNFKFRASKSVWESECFLLCKDYWLEGYNKVILNPNIKFAYEYIDYYRSKYIDPIITTHFYFYYYFNFLFNDNPASDDLENSEIKLRKDWKFYI